MNLGIMDPGMDPGIMDPDLDPGPEVFIVPQMQFDKLELPRGRREGGRREG